MGMSLTLTPSCYATLKQICGLCEIHPVTDVDIDVQLFGAKKYCYCPHCKNSTVGISQDPIWQLTCDLYAEQKERR